MEIRMSEILWKLVIKLDPSLLKLKSSPSIFDVYFRTVIVLFELFQIFDKYQIRFDVFLGRQWYAPFFFLCSFLMKYQVLNTSNVSLHTPRTLLVEITIHLSIPLVLRIAMSSLLYVMICLHCRFNVTNIRWFLIDLTAVPASPMENLRWCFTATLMVATDLVTFSLIRPAGFLRINDL